MKREIAELWTEALRSGDYQQATGTLLRTDTASGEAMGHCCLGVLCELAVQQGVEVQKSTPERYWFGPDDDDVEYGGVTFNDRDDLLPKVVKDWAEMKTFDGEINDDGNDFWTTLAEMNDGGKSFREIANVIEKYTEVL